MRTFLVFLVLNLFIFNNLAFARKAKPLYQLPAPPAAEDSPSSKIFLAGSDKGLFKITSGNTAIPLWSDGAVEQILRTEMPDDSGNVTEEWFFRTSKGILHSSDLSTFEFRNEGLPLHTIKKYDGTNTEFENLPPPIKDIAVDPLNPWQLVTATNDAVYLSRDGGRKWASLQSMSGATPGVKAAAVASLPAEGGGTETVVFMSHPIFGLSYIRVDAKKPEWNDVDEGFEKMPSLTSPDEISDILPVLRKTEDGGSFVEIYLSQSYLPRIYRFDWEKRAGECIYRGTEPADSIDALTRIGDVLIYSRLEGIGAVDMNTLASPGVPERLEEWKKSFSCVPGFTNAAWIPAEQTGFQESLCLNELWMLYPGSVNTRYAASADGRKSVYASAYQCRLQSGIDKFKKIIRDNNLNSLVIDMKDDYGLLRYDTKDPLLLEKGKMTQYAVDLDHFIEEFKKDGVYLIARIVVFKDRNLAAYGDAKYAVWNAKTKSPWVGIKEYEDIVDESTGAVKGRRTVYYDENWVDPYSPEVWEYNVAVAKELIARGFDEIQFDYIRFPTDGYNLRQASYRWKSEGMDKESALISFLLYARQNIDAPIGIDIYGANGWYRSGTRTGQDAELLAEYVDVICPMFYPSHFEQSFLNYAPLAERPYRIYYYGTYRASVMTRNRAVIRPWVQAFYLNVSYDRQYYDNSYVQKEIFGVRDSVNRGYMYWNNSGDYSVILPDVTDDVLYTGPAPEADLKFRKPALGIQKMPPYIDGGVSVLDSILDHSGLFGGASAPDSAFIPLLRVLPGVLPERRR